MRRHLKRSLSMPAREPRISPGEAKTVIEHDSTGGVGGRDDRRGRRVVVDLAASVGGRAPHEARVLDVSLVGCLIRIDTDLGGGAVVDLVIEIPDAPVRTKAHVAQSSVDGHSLSGPPRYLAGLEFIGLGAADEARLRSFIDAEARRRAGAGQPPA
jgi:hypothetical protein